MILVIGKSSNYNLVVPLYQDFYEPLSGEFDFYEYLKGIPEENQEFYKKLVNTQMFRTFIKDSYHENYPEIREFKQYISIIQANNSSKVSGEPNNTVDTFLESQRTSSNRHIHSPDKQIKLKALTFKQNMEILNLLETFDDDSDNESTFEESKICNL
jgi:hypothetical protein